MKKQLQNMIFFRVPGIGNDIKGKYSFLRKLELEKEDVSTIFLSKYRDIKQNQYFSQKWIEKIDMKQGDF